MSEVNSKLEDGNSITGTLTAGLSASSMLSVGQRKRTTHFPESPNLIAFARRLKTVTRREFEVFEQVMEGLTALQIGERLGISPRTVDVHKARFIQKVQVDNMVVAARYFTCLETLTELNADMISEATAL